MNMIWAGCIISFPLVWSSMNFDCYFTVSIWDVGVGSKWEQKIFIFLLWRDLAPRYSMNLLFHVHTYIFAQSFSQLNWGLLSDLSALVPLQCSSWMFNRKAGCVGPAKLGLLLDRNILTRGRAEVKSSGSYKYRKPGTAPIGKHRFEPKKPV